jgi:hypothetical protein
VIGASAGGLPAFSKLTSELPNDLQAAIFIVWHLSPHQRSILPEILNKAGNLPATNATDGTADNDDIFARPFFNCSTIATAPIATVQIKSPSALDLVDGAPSGHQRHNAEKHPATPPHIKKHDCQHELPRFAPVSLSLP